MKTIGLVGGLSWESSVEYYRIINQTINARLGGLHSAKILLYSFDFAEIEMLQHQHRWQEATQQMIQVAQRLENAGADFLLICSNTMHLMAEQVEQQTAIPLLHIADATAQTITAQSFKKVGLLGTQFTMEQDFYKGRLAEKYHLEVLIPDAESRAEVHQIIYDELCRGQIRAASKEKYKDVIERMVLQGAEAIILGCTEISLLIQPEDSSVPLFDTTQIHAEAAVTYALREN